MTYPDDLKRALGEGERCPACDTVKPKGAECRHCAALARAEVKGGPKLPLTRDQRSKLFAGEQPTVTFPGPPEPCPVEAGHVEVLSRNVWVEVTEIRRTAEGNHSLGYTLHNERLGSRFMAKQHGQVHPEQYATSPAGSIDPEAGEAVDDFTQKRITREAMQKAQDRKHKESGDLLAAMQNLRDSIDTMPPGQKRRINRTLWTLRSRLDSAERELRRRNAA